MNGSASGREGALLLRPAEAAALLAVSRTRVYELAARGDLPGVIRLGGSVRIHRPTLEAWLREEAGGCQSRVKTG
jgi:excisionase family DNA binding protein